MRLESRANFHMRELITNLALKNLRSTYQDSLLGFGWSLISPLITILVYTAVFTFILPGRPAIGDPSGLSQFGLFLASGILPWQYGAGLITGQANSLIGARGLLQKLYVPKWIMPLSLVISRLVTFLGELAVLMLVLGLGFDVWVFQFVPLLIVVIALHSSFLFGMGVGLSVLTVYFRDVEHIFGIIVRLWFWTTPIIYSIDRIADQNRSLLGIDAVILWKLNPMFWFIESYRNVLFDARNPSLAAIGIMAGCAALSGLIGWAIYRRMSPRLVERL